MNLKNYFNEIKYFLKENIDDFEDFYDFEDEDEDAGETPPEDKDASQSEGNDLNNTPEEQNSAPAPLPSGEPDLRAAGVTADNNPSPAPAAPDQGGDADQQTAGVNPGTDQSGNTGQQTGNPQIDKRQGGDKSGTAPTPQPGTEKFGTILDQLKGLLDTFEQAKKAAGFETIDAVKKAAQENPVASGGSTNGAAANTGGSGTSPV